MSTNSDGLFMKVQSALNQGGSSGYSPYKELREDQKQLSGITKFHDPLIMKNMPDILNRRDDPISYKYFVMTRDLDESAVKDITPNKEE